MGATATRPLKYTTEIGVKHMEDRSVMSAHAPRTLLAIVLFYTICENAILMCLIFYREKSNV